MDGGRLLSELWITDEGYARGHEVGSFDTETAREVGIQILLELHRSVHMVEKGTCMNISPSEIGDLMRCQRSWSLTSDKGRNLEYFGGPAAAFGMGDLIHVGLEAQVYHMWGSPITPEEAIKAAAEKEKQHAMLRYQKKMGAIWSSEEGSTYDTQAELAVSYIQHYLAKWGPNPWAPYEVLVPELTFRVPIPGCDLEDGHLIGTVDKLLLDPQRGELHILDHKSYTQETRYDTEITNMQFMCYSWGIYQLVGQPVESFIYDGIRKKLPRQPKRLVSGALSQEWTADVTYSTFREALEEVFGTRKIPPEYASFVNRLHDRDAQDETPYFKRMELRYTYPVIANIQRQLARIHDYAVSVRGAGLEDAIPDFIWSGCWDCKVRPICVAMQYGQDYEGIIEREFVQAKGWRTTIRQQGEPLEVTSINDLVQYREQLKAQMLSDTSI